MNCCYIAHMDRQAIIARLREQEADLRAWCRACGAVRLTRPRRQSAGQRYGYPDRDRSDSDLSIWGYVGLKQFVASLFDGRVDVVDREALKPYVAPCMRSDRDQTKFELISKPNALAISPA